MLTADRIFADISIFPQFGTQNTLDWLWTEDLVPCLEGYKFTSLVSVETLRRRLPLANF